MVLYIGIYIESDWLYHAEWVALSNGQSGSELAEYSFFIRDARNHQQSSVLSMYSKNGTISLEVKQVLWLMRSSTVLLMTATRSTSQALMLSMTDQC